MFFGLDWALKHTNLFHTSLMSYIKFYFAKFCKMYSFYSYVVFIKFEVLLLLNLFIEKTYIVDLGVILFCDCDTFMLDVANRTEPPARGSIPFPGWLKA